MGGMEWDSCPRLKQALLPRVAGAGSERREGVERAVCRAAHAVYTALPVIKSQYTLRGAIAQLGERIVRNDEVVGSIPTSSTNL